MGTDDSNQPLRENAVQSGHKVVWLDAHVQESAQHVQYVIGVDRSKDKVSGKGRVDGDLRGFLVANFADHDFIGIVAQNGSQSAGEGQSFLLVNRDLRNALDLIFDGVFDGDNLVFIVLDFAERGVQSR